MSHNKDLENHINAWTERAENAEKLDDLYAVTTEMVDYGKPIRFKLARYWLTALALAAATIWVFIETLWSRFYPEWLESLAQMIGWSPFATGMTVAVVSGVLTLMALYAAGRREKLIKLLSDAIMHQANMIRYGLEPIGNIEVARLEKTFGDLCWGNHERSFHECYQGQYQGDEHSFTYQPFRLHFVDKDQERVYNKKTRKREIKTVYNHYNRSGIVVDFPYAQGLHICQHFETTLYGEPYKPASLEFTKAFHCRGQDAETLARFLKPATVQFLTETANAIPNLSIEINEDGKMCLACGNYHVVDSTPELTRETNPRFSPKGFDRFVRLSMNMPDLDKLTELAHTLMRYSDSNFSRKPA